jgi:hypothetical protein
MGMIALESLSPYLSMHIKNVQIGVRPCHMHQFEDKFIMDSELETNMRYK